MPNSPEELDGIRIRGIPESTEKEARVRQEHDLAEVQKLLTHMEVNAIIGDVIRLGRYNENKTRTILLKVPNAYQRRMVLLSARKLKTFSLCQSVISGSLTLSNTKIRSFGMKFYFSKIRMEPVMLSFLATTENIKYKIRTTELQLRESCQINTVENCYSQFPSW